MQSHVVGIIVPIQVRAYRNISGTCIAVSKNQSTQQGVMVWVGVRSEGEIGIVV